MPADCHMAADADSAPQGSEAHAGCDTCQLCFAWALPAAIDLPAPAVLRPGAPAPWSSAFGSADPRLDIRPPIA